MVTCVQVHLIDRPTHLIRAESGQAKRTSTTKKEEEAEESISVVYDTTVHETSNIHATSVCSRAPDFQKRRATLFGWQLYNSSSSSNKIDNIDYRILRVDRWKELWTCSRWINRTAAAAIDRTREGGKTCCHICCCSR